MITVVGSLNMDLVTEVEYTPSVGETILGNGLEQIPGGKGANQGVTIGKLGGNVHMIGKIGTDDYGKALLKSLKESGVKSEHVMVSKESTGLAFIMVNANGDNSIVVIPGANFDIDQEDIRRKEDVIKSSDVLVCQLESPLEVIEEALNIAKTEDTFTILNPAPGKVLPKSILKKIDLLTPNESELEILTGETVVDEESLLRACEILLNDGIKQLIVTLGEKGSLLVKKSGHKKFKAIKVEAIDTTAAGDSFTGALAFAIDEGKSIEEAIDLATHVAAISVTKKGAQSSLPSMEAVEKFMKGR
jgi:ribokinase